MTKVDFVTDYCKKTQLNKKIFNQMLVVLECNCDEPNCHGWAAVTNDPYMVKKHMDKNINGKND